MTNWDEYPVIDPHQYKAMISGEFHFPANQQIIIRDHLGGFKNDYSNYLLDSLNSRKIENEIITEYVFNNEVLKKYPNLDIKFSRDTKVNMDFRHFNDYKIHPEINFKNFLCSFNGSNHVGRQLLTSIIDNFGLFNENYTSKNFKYTDEDVVGHLLNLDLTQSQQRLYSKFFVNDETFSNTVYSFGHVQYDHASNIYNLEYKLTESFVHLVSESMSTSYYPFVTEKFLYSVVTRGLFVTYGQASWHNHVEKYFGFKKYNKIFDYSFDIIKNPVERLVRLMEMISKFSKLSSYDLNDLYLMELDTIEYNYDHYFSKKYLEFLKAHE